MRAISIPVTLGVVATLAACGEGGGDVTASESSDQPQRFTATATVLESPEHGPQLCLGAVATSLPPQCGGPDITNWDWDEVDGAESMAGTTWGFYTVVGTYDGDRFTLTEPPAQPDEQAVSAEPTPTFPTPCPEPEGGWAVVDEATATEEAMYAAIAYADGQPDHAGTWVDQSINPAMADSDADVEAAANDPTTLVLNIRFTGDLDRHEAELRAIWGGALCISLAEHTEAELRAIQDELHGEFPNVLMSSVNSVTGMVEFEVAFDDGSLQQEADNRYSVGVVQISSRLRPVD